MQEIRIKSKVREEIGKKSVHELRSSGMVPAVLYGHKEEPLALSIKEHDLWQILHNSTSEHIILTLDIEGGKESSVMTLVRDVQHDPVTGNPLHVDFQRIAIDEKIKVGVPVELVGISPDVKDFCGVLDHGVREVMVRCTPTEIPESLTIDVSHLKIGQSIHLSDVWSGYGDLEFIDDGNLTLAHVSPPKKIEEVEGAVEEVSEEVVGEGEEAGAPEEKTSGKGKES